MEKEKGPFVQIKADGGIRYRMKILSTSEGTDYFIPGFNLFFSVQDKAKADQRARHMMTAFFDLWIRDSGPKQFFLQLHKLGFRSPNHDHVMQKVLKRNPIRSAKFSSPLVNTMDGFDQSQEVEEDLAVAV